jgi:hypothetical protein
MPTLVARLALPLLLGLAALVPTPAEAAVPVDDYAHYDPQRHCGPRAKPGTVVFADWLVWRHGGTAGAISRRCTVGGTSEHKEGRAFDWTIDARNRDDRVRANRFLAQVLRSDRRGNPHVLARRMGIMYVIWKDRIWSSYHGFRERPYLSAGCPTLQECSATARHRDHMHISLSRRGGWGRTSWYAGRLPAPEEPVS